MSDRLFYTIMFTLGALIVLLLGAAVWAIGYQHALETDIREACAAINGTFLDVRGINDLCVLEDGTLVDPEVYRAK